MTFAFIRYALLYQTKINMSIQQLYKLACEQLHWKLAFIGSSDHLIIEIHVENYTIRIRFQDNTKIPFILM